jgi:hypothetical protein
MDKKQQAPSAPPQSLEVRKQRNMTREWTPRRIFIIFLLTLTLWLLTRHLNNTYNISLNREALFSVQNTPLGQALVVAEKNVTRVPLEAHIMSKCPDAQACLQMLVLPTMEIIHDKVDFRLSFIGRRVYIHN